MTCGRIRKRLIAYVEGSLAQAERREIEAHLESCADCARELKGLSETAHILRAARPPSAEPAPGFTSRVAASLERRAPAPWTQRWAPATASAMAVVVLAVTLLVGNWHRIAAPPQVAHEKGPRATATAPAPEGATALPHLGGETARQPAEPTREAGQPEPSIVARGPEPTAPTVRSDAESPAGPAESADMADASASVLYGMAGGGVGITAPGGPAAEATEDETDELAARPVSVGPYNSDDEGSRLEEAMALFGY